MQEAEIRALVLPVALSEQNILGVRIMIPKDSGLTTFSINQIKFMVVEHPRAGKTRCVFDASFITAGSQLTPDGSLLVAGRAPLSEDLAQLIRHWIQVDKTNIMMCLIVQETSAGKDSVQTRAHYVNFSDVQAV